MNSNPAADSSAPRGQTLGNLPGQLTPIIGRGGALAELRRLLWQTRLLSLCGPGGAGKSRLAVALADSVSDDLVGGAWWADLADHAEDGLVAQAVAAAVLPGEPLGDPRAALARHLSPASLLVLDNCEQVTAGCARLAADLLGRASALRIVVTSRQPLGLPGEQVWRVGGLTVGESGAGAQADEDAAGATQLFLARAREASSRFAAQDARERVAVDDICRFLDGQPLAIELAAARVSVLSARQIAQRIREDMSLLRRPGHAAPPRQRTLQDTLDWSHRLLRADEQILFRRLGAFRGHFALEAVEAVCAGEDLPAGLVLDLLSRLVDQSLVQAQAGHSLPRYRMLSTVRQYALAKLAESGERPELQRRHAAYYHELGPAARDGLSGSEHLRWLETLELDMDNLREGLRWLLEHDPLRAAELACALWPFCYQRGYYAEARGWLSRALEHEQALAPALRVETLSRAGAVAFLQCDYSVAAGLLERVLALTDGRPDPFAALARQRLGSIAREQARYEQARRLHEQSRELWEALGDEEGVAGSWAYLGFADWLAGAYARAETECSLALETFRRRRNETEIVSSLISYGAAALYRADTDAASDRLEEALALSRRIGFQEGIAWSLNLLAVLARRRRRRPAAIARMLRDSLTLHEQLGDRWRMASVLEEIADLVARADAPTAARLFGAAAALRERIGAPVPAAEAEDRRFLLARLARQLAPADLEARRAEGRALPEEEAVVLADRAIEELQDATAEDLGEEPPILTPRELAVLGLLSRGHTNREIAAVLFISPSTAGVHVSNILRKLSAKRRVDAAQRAQALGLLSAA